MFQQNCTNKSRWWARFNLQTIVCRLASRERHCPEASLLGRHILSAQAPSLVRKQMETYITVIPCFTLCPESGEGAYKRNVKQEIGDTACWAHRPSPALWS